MTTHTKPTLEEWIKVRDEGRMKLVAVDRREVENYLLISKLPPVTVTTTFDLPQYWTVDSVSYDPERRAFIFLVFSPSFDPVLVGTLPDMIAADHHTVEIVRKEVKE